MDIPQHIFDILQKRLAKEPLTEPELNELQQWYLQGEANNHLFGEQNFEEGVLHYLASISNQEKNDEALVKFMAKAAFADQTLPAPDFSNEREVDQTAFPVAHRVHFLKRGWFKYAAAVIILFGLGAYLYFNNPFEQQNAGLGTIAKTDILPGANKALLTLSDGTTITLDSAANGAIAQQGNSSIVKLSNGKIIYNLKGTSQGQVMMNTMQTPRGGQYQLMLPDGTKVWLNAASSITYPAVFVGSDRKIKITGEAYLEVAPNEAKPFIVDIDGKSTVQVLGTSFNINSYADEGGIKTTLVEGSVRVVPINEDAGAMILKPGQQATITGDKIAVLPNTNIEQVLAWKNGYFSFENMGLREMARQLERWYDIKVEFVGQFSDISFKGDMDRGVKLSGIMRFFESYGFKVSLEGKVLVLKK